MKPMTTALLMTAVELAPLHHVEEEAGEERPRPERDDGQVQVDPEAEGEAVVHVRLVEAHREAEVRGVEPDAEEGGPGHEPEQEAAEGGADEAARDESFIHGSSRRPPRCGRRPGAAPSRARCGSRPSPRSPAAPGGGRSPALLRGGRPRSPGRPGSPKTIAPAGQASTQAGVYAGGFASPPAAACASWAACSRWLQKVHFSTTPRVRVETSGLSVSVSRPGHSGSHQLKDRAW